MYVNIVDFYLGFSFVEFFFEEFDCDLSDFWDMLEDDGEFSKVVSFELVKSLCLRNVVNLFLLFFNKFFFEDYYEEVFFLGFGKLFEYISFYIFCI